MIKVYNLFTNTVQTKASYYNLNKDDIVMYEEFKNIIVKNNDYFKARTDMISNAIDRCDYKYGEETHDIIRNLSRIKENHFKHNESIDISVLHNELENTILVKQQIYTFNTISIHIKNQLSYIFHKMNEIDFYILVDISKKCKELLFLTLQPFFISLINIKEYVKHIPYLIYEDNFTNLILQCKAISPYKTYIFDNFISIIPFKNIIMLSSSLIVTPIICYTIYNSYNRSSNDKLSNAFIIPKIKRPGFDNKYFSVLGDFLYKLGGELGLIMGQLPTGMSIGVLATAQERINKVIGGD